MNLLPLKHQSVFTEDNFFVSSSNKKAHKIVMMWPMWRHPVTVFFGPGGVGKSHLGHIWAHKSNASVMYADAPWQHTTQNLLIEEAHLLVASKAHQHKLLKAINTILENATGGIVLLSKTPPAYWSLQLPDLASRLKAATVMAIHEPDEHLLRIVAKKLIKERQLSMSEQALSYLLTRVERSIASVCLWMERLDNASLEQERRISVEMIKRIIMKHH